MSRWINANYGTVRAVSTDKSTIKVAAPRGGVFKCKNEGFEIGQEVCFILDALNRYIIKVLPKEVADMQALLGLNPDLQEVMQDEPLMGIDRPKLTEEQIYGKIVDGQSTGSGDKGYVDILSGINGEIPQGEEDSDWPGNQV